jgi:hypothetical protein
LSGSTTIELALFVVASLGIVLSTAVVLRMMRSRAMIAKRSQQPHR